MQIAVNNYLGGRWHTGSVRGFKSAVACIVSLALLVSPLSAYAVADPVTPAQDYAAAQARLDQYMHLVQQLRDDIDRSEFEIDALLDKLDLDADAIIGFVTQDIAFEQYPGLLRGAQGTLMSRAGNALDQAILLATLLNDAAYETRIASGQLNATQTQLLLQQLGKRTPEKASDKLERYQDALSKMAALVAIPEDQIAAFVATATRDIVIKDTVEYQDAIAERTFVLDQLHQAGATLNPLDITQALKAEARDYYWVEYRDGPSDAWSPVHPAFGDTAVDLSALQHAQVFKKEIPDALQHRFRVEFFVEQKTGDTLQATSLMGPWEKPAANLVGTSLQFTNVPDGLQSHAEMEHPQAVADATKFLIPIFKADGKTAAQSSLFDLSGIVVDAATANNAAAGLFQTLGNKMEGALANADVLGTDKKPTDEAYRALSAQWIDFTQIYPGGREETTRRYVMDRIGADNRAKGITDFSVLQDREAIIWQLASSQTFNLTTGTYPQSYIFDKYLQRLQSARPLFEQSLQQQFQPDKPVAFSASELNKIVDSPALIVADSFNRLDAAQKTSINYHYVPALTVFKNEFAFSNKQLAASMVVDIVSNSKRSLRHEGERIVYAANDNILSGTWVTRLEELDSAAVASDQANRWNTRMAFQLARDNDLEFVVLKPQDVAGVDAIAGISNETRAGITQDLNDGFHVIVPEQAIDQQARSGWWRVNTQTGETLGRINEGIGGNIVNYTTLITGVSLVVSAVLAIPGYMDCRQNKQSGGRMCSLSGCLKGAGIGVLIGTAVGYSVGLIAAALAAPGAIAVGSVGVFKYSHAAPEAIQIGIEIGVARGLDIANAVKALPSVPNCIE